MRMLNSDSRRRSAVGRMPSVFGPCKVRPRKRPPTMRIRAFPGEVASGSPSGNATKSFSGPACRARGFALRCLKRAVFSRPCRVLCRARRDFAFGHPCPAAHRFAFYFRSRVYPRSVQDGGDRPWNAERILVDGDPFAACHLSMRAWGVSAVHAATFLPEFSSASRRCRHAPRAVLHDRSGEIDIGDSTRCARRAARADAGCGSPRRALRQIAELERAERHADQPVHPQAEMLQHVAHFAVLALADRKGEPDYWRPAGGRAWLRSRHSACRPPSRPCATHRAAAA